MGKLSWSAEAKADLKNIAPAIREQIKRNAEKTLPDIQFCTGAAHGILWHRGITHVEEVLLDWAEQEDVDGLQAWDYYLYYRKLHPEGAEDPPAADSENAEGAEDPEGFEVLAVLSTHQHMDHLGWHIAWEPPPDAEEQTPLRVHRAITGSSAGPGSPVQSAT